MRQKVDSAKEPLYIDLAIRKSTALARGIRILTDEEHKVFAVIVRAVTVPHEWASLAFSHGARRHDYGNGPMAQIIWLMPLVAAPHIMREMAILLDHVRQHEVTAATIRSGQGAFSCALSSI